MSDTKMSRPGDHCPSCVEGVLGDWSDDKIECTTCSCQVIVRWWFDTQERAEGFIEGIEFVNDSGLLTGIVVHAATKNQFWVAVEDQDLEHFN